MDVNGTKYHLLYGPADWGLCLADSGQPLAELWAAHADSTLVCDPDTGDLRLESETPLFPRSGRTPPLEPSARRGAGRDRYGNWYWIDPDESGIRFLPAGTRAPVAWWHAADRAAACTPGPAGGFGTCRPAPPPTLLLRGLAVTAHHYLVAGDVTERGLLIWDLHRGGPPLLLRWPDAVPFAPWDLAPTPDGGVLILDRDHLAYWRLDATFRLPARVGPDTAALFQPEAPDAPRERRPGAALPEGFALGGSSPPGSPPAPLAPISIEAGPAGSVLILDSVPDRPYSLIYEYEDGTLLATYSLEDAVAAMDPRLGEGVVELYSVAGHDFAYSPTGLGGAGSTPPAAPCGCPGDDPPPGTPTLAPIVYVAERDGKQVLAFALDRAQQKAVDQRQFLPLRRWGGKALVAAGGEVFYDFGERWVPLAVYMECHYAGRGVLTTPLSFAEEIPGRPFDGDDPGCVWHRLFLDATIPPGCAVHVRARAADDVELLPATGWLAQPDPYLRDNGAEIPYYDPWAPRPADGVPPDTGTWELLFQEVRGRYLQLEITVVGTGRTTPALRALRAWYPRFSYLEHYLPAIYREEPGPASFLERWLANFEGFYTYLEEEIAHAAALFDPRTAPVEALDWLACWFGLVLDPLWPEDRRRFFLRHADAIYRCRGTVHGVEIAVRLYLDPHLDDSLFNPGCWGQSKVRIVERWLTRRIGGLAYGDPTQPGVPLTGPLTPDIVQASAHRFVVLVPAELSDEDEAMVGRIVELAKPAHTAFDLRRYWDLFRVGEARLGLDTALGCSSTFCPLLLGTSYLPDAYLQAPYPFDLADRMVLNRDRLGDLPRL